MTNLPDMESIGKKEKKDDLRVSIIMPVYNGKTTLQKTLESLLHQSEYFQELIIIDDASSDESAQIIRNLIHGKENFHLIQNEKNIGLAKSYNIGIRKSRGDLIVTMHQDIVLTKNALGDLTEPFKDIGVVAAGHADIHPIGLWKKYNFWQKCFFARFRNRKDIGINGQFDCFRKSALERVGLFDEKNFRTAGEDADVVYNLRKIGKVAGSAAKTIHLHKIDPNFSWQDIVRKQAQYSEAQGALLRRGRIGKIIIFVRSFFREILIVALLVPYVRILSLVLIALYSFLYTKNVYFEKYRDKRILILPFFNIYLLFVGLFYSLRGFLYGKQRV